MGTTERKTAAKKAAFLEAYGECGTITYAAQAAGIDRSHVYRWRDGDKAFAKALIAAADVAADALEKEARKRAVTGVAEEVYQGGELVGTKQRYSDVLLIFLLKGARPEKYRDNVRHEHSGLDGDPIQVEATAEVAGSTLEVLRELGLAKK